MAQRRVWAYPSEARLRSWVDACVADYADGRIIGTILHVPLRPGAAWWPVIAGLPECLLRSAPARAAGRAGAIVAFGVDALIPTRRSRISAEPIAAAPDLARALGRAHHHPESGPARCATGACPSRLEHLSPRCTTRRSSSASSLVVRHREDAAIAAREHDRPRGEPFGYRRTVPRAFLDPHVYMGDTVAPRQQGA